MQSNIAPKPRQPIRKRTLRHSATSCLSFTSHLQILPLESSLRRPTGCAQRKTSYVLCCTARPQCLVSSGFFPVKLAISSFRRHPCTSRPTPNKNSQVGFRYFSLQKRRIAQKRYQKLIATRALVSSQQQLLTSKRVTRKDLLKIHGCTEADRQVTVYGLTLCSWPVHQSTSRVRSSMH